MRLELKAMYDLLLEQKAVQQELLTLSYEKRQVIIEADTDRLSEMTRLEQRLVIKLRNLEKKRLKLLPALTAVLGVAENEANISGIIDRAGPDEREPFRRIQKELGGLLSAQQEINKLNSQLLETHLEYADNMLSVLVGDEDPLNNFYGAGGASPDRKRATGFIDHQA